MITNIGAQLQLNSSSLRDLFKVSRLKDSYVLVNAKSSASPPIKFHLVFQGFSFRDDLSGIHYFSKRHWC